MSHISTIAKLHCLLRLKAPVNNHISYFDAKTANIFEGNLRTLSTHDTEALITYGFYVIVSNNEYVTMIPPFQETDATDIVNMKNNWIICFDADLFRRNGLGQLFNTYLSIYNNISGRITLPKDTLQDINIIINLIKEEFCEETNQLNEEFITSAMNSLHAYLMRIRKDHKGKVTNYRTRFIGQIGAALDVITKSQGLSQSVPTVKDLASVMGYSKNELNNILKMHTGKSSQEYIHFYIIEKAKNRLLENNNYISEIAYSQGFKDPSYFSRLFKLKTGVSPSLFRKMNT